MTWIFKLLPFLSKIGGWQLYLIIAVSAASVGAYGAYKVTAWRYDASYAKALEIALNDQQAAIEKNRKIEIKYIEKAGKEKIIYKTKIKEVIKYVKQTTFVDVQCFDDNGLQLYSEALAGKASSISDGKMP